MPVMLTDVSKKSYIRAVRSLGRLRPSLQMPCPVPEHRRPGTAQPLNVLESPPAPPNRRRGSAYPPLPHRSAGV